MKRHFIFFFMSCYMQLLFAQQEKTTTVTGFYNMTQMEMASGLYLLEDASFYYYAIFGNVNLDLYGDYQIKEKEIKLEPEARFVNEFRVYGSQEQQLKNEIQIDYEASRGKRDKMLYINVGNKWIPYITIENSRQEVISRTFKQQTTAAIQLAYGIPISKEEALLDKVYTIKIPKAINIIRIKLYSYAGFATALKEGAIHIIAPGKIQMNEKEYTKKNIPEDIQTKVKNRIQSLKEKALAKQQTSNEKSLLITEGDVDVFVKIVDE
ncbi:hypothetical protein [Aquimarina rhabdastrellae]